MTKIAPTSIRKIGGSYTLLIPNKLYSNEQFPFKEGEEGLIMKVFRGKLVVEKYV